MNQFSYVNIKFETLFDGDLFVVDSERRVQCGMHIYLNMNPKMPKTTD